MDATLVLSRSDASAGAPELVELLDGGEQAYPRMLSAIASATRSVHLQVYAFAPRGVGARFIEALALAAARRVTVEVLIDGWGSARGGRAVAAALREAGCTVRVHNRLLSLLAGRFGRNHRKVLLVDDEVAFLGGINIGDENLDEAVRVGWADLALEIRGPQCARLAQMVRGQRLRSVDGSLRIYFCGLGGGWRLRRRYLDAFTNARERIHVAHGYFLPDPGIVRAITAAARRGVQVRLLLAGQSNHPLARAATRSLYRRLLSSGVTIREWSDSVLHAKVATVDGRRLLVGSFNLDPFSLANLEALVEVDDALIVQRGEAWIQDRFASSSPITLVKANSRLQRWLLDSLGRFVARLADAISRLMASRKQRREPPGHAHSSPTPRRVKGRPRPTTGILARDESARGPLAPSRPSEVAVPEQQHDPREVHSLLQVHAQDAVEHRRLHRRRAAHPLSAPEQPELVGLLDPGHLDLVAARHGLERDVQLAADRDRGARHDLSRPASPSTGAVPRRYRPLPLPPGTARRSSRRARGSAAPARPFAAVPPRLVPPAPGCIADLEGCREDALAHYEQARGEGASDATAKLARRFEERPYRGFEKDG